MKGWEKVTLTMGVIGVLVAALALGRDVFDFTIPGLQPGKVDSTANAGVGGQRTDTGKAQPTQNPKSGHITQPPGGSDSHQDEEPPVAPVVDPEISLSPAEGPAGSSFTITGRGYTPRGKVTVRFHVDVVAEGRAGDDGSFSFAAHAPSDLSVFAPKSFSVRATDSATLRNDEAQFMLVL